MNIFKRKKFPAFTSKDFKAVTTSNNEVEIVFLNDVSIRKGEKISISIQIEPVSLKPGTLFDGSHVK